MAWEVGMKRTAVFLSFPSFLFVRFVCLVFGSAESVPVLRPREIMQECN